MKAEAGVDTGEFFELFRYLVNEYCLIEEKMEFVESVRSESERYGSHESDPARPMKIIPDPEGCIVLVAKRISDETMEQRMNALRMRSQTVKAVGYDWADMLDTPHRKLAYLFLKEYARTLPDSKDDELKQDEWALAEMKRLGYLKT
jgi:hypothetical protein